MLPDGIVPPAFEELFTPSRYKIYYGGRGGAKSWAYARALLTLAAKSNVRILCAREIQKSIKDSVHKLLSDQIKILGLESAFQILETEIRGVYGSLFSFVGLKHNTTNIKSHEGADICWVEEAHAVSKSSWDILIPTIRKPGSEIWVSFNPELEDDNTYQRFVVNPPDNAIVKKVGYQDNPWFPDVLEEERLALKERDPDAYSHVWEGNCRQMLDGAIYANELRLAAEEGRITKVPYDASRPVDVFFDLGWADHTSIWFTQTIGLEIRMLKYYQNNLQPIQHYIQTLQGSGYVIGKVHLPHDAQAKQLGTGRSIEEIMRSSGFNVVVVPKLSIDDGISAARTVFGACWFDREKCSDGLQALRHYRYDVDPDSGKYSQRPLHDWSSHGADAFRYFAVGYKRPVDKKPVKLFRR